MSDQKIIGCNDDLDGFPCIDCRFRDDESGCLEYRMTWNLTPLYDKVDDGMDKKCIQLGEVLI